MSMQSDINLIARIVRANAKDIARAKYDRIDAKGILQLQQNDSDIRSMKDEIDRLNNRQMNILCQFGAE